MPVTMPQAFKAGLERLEKRLLQKRWVRLVVGIAYNLGYHEAGDMAASLSYYTLLAIFPMIIGVIASLGFFVSSNLVKEQLLTLLTARFPISVDSLEESVASLVTSRGVLGVVSLAGLFWSGSALFTAIRRVINRAWDIKKMRPFYLRKFRDLILAVGTGIIFFISLGLTAVSTLLPPGTPPFGVPLVTVAFEVIVFLLIFAAFLLIYKYVPNTSVAWRDIWPGALLGVSLFEIVRNLFTWYLVRFSNFQLIYGPIASIIAFLVWIYVSAFVLIIGAEFSSVYVRMRRQSNS